jgi:phosphate:Na+ symporter
VTFGSIISLIGGIGLFLFGMSLLGSSLEKLAGAKLESTLAKLTDNRFKALGLGVFVTCVIQSSAATSVMVLGFINAGIMRLVQAVPVIMGANIGTTITAQILRFNDLSGGMLQYISPSTFAPILIATGALIMIVNKKSKVKNFCSLIIGFGILFVGMSTMSTALTPLKDSDLFKNFLLMLKNPFLGVLVGMVITAVLQSSSASVGILQSLAPTGLLQYSTAVPIVIGMNIGKCVTVAIASIGTNKKAKRAVIIDVINNTIGAIIFLVVIYLYETCIGFHFWNSTLTSGDIANFHTIFNIVTVAILFPIYPFLIKFTKKLLGDSDESKIDKELALLDDLFLKTPSLALQQCKSVAITMGETAKDSYDIASQLLEHYDDHLQANMDENEQFLDKSETLLGEYLIKVTAKELDKTQTRTATEIMHSLGDFERIGDYSTNIAEISEYMQSHNIEFSIEEKQEIGYIFKAVKAIIDMTVECYSNHDKTIAYRVEPLEETIDELVEILKDRRVIRLQNGLCSVEKGISFVELLTNLERISDHCSNIAVREIEPSLNSSTHDTHEILKQLHSGPTEEYKALYSYYKSQYCAPIEKINISSETYEYVQ